MLHEYWASPYETKSSIFTLIIVRAPRAFTESHFEQLTVMPAQLTQPLLNYGPPFKLANYYTRNTNPPELGYSMLFAKKYRAVNIEQFVSIENII